jgi:hypothetical protein
VRRLSFALFAWLSLTVSGFGDERTQRMLATLAEEAANFERIAIDLISEETLHQIAVTDAKPKRNSKESGPSKPEWVQREIKSEYVFASVGEPKEFKEIRKVTSVNGKPVADAGRAVEQLMQTVQSGSDRSRRKLLEDFEKHGLVGTVTDFGQLLLLFGRANQEGYSFTFAGERYLGAELCHLFKYEQQDGAGALTVYSDAGKQQPKISGEIWMTRNAYRLLRLTLKSNRREKSTEVREEAQVDYVPTTHGAVVPVSVVHHQYRGGSLTTENRFAYTEFRKFGASAVLKYATDEQVKKP